MTIKQIHKLNDKRILILMLMFTVCFGSLYSQSDSSLYANHYQYSEELNRLSLFSNSIKEIKSAIEIAKKNNWEKRYLNASISLGELMRRTADFMKGIEILEKLNESYKYPKIHVRKLGRLAALYMEGGSMENRSNIDSIIKYFDESLEIAQQNNFRELEASISNDFGTFKYQTESINAGDNLLKRSAFLYKELNDSHNYVNAMCHLVHTTYVQNERKRAKEIGEELLKIVDGKKWYTTKQTLYRTYANMTLTEGDSLSHFKWKVKEIEEAIKFLKASSDNDMSLIRVEYDTEKFKNNALLSKQEADNKDIQLNKEKKYSNYLLLAIGAFLILALIVVYLFFKQKRLSENLKISMEEISSKNDSYQLLMIESNHRIKNNLQMVISMLEYASQDVKDFGPKALKKISSKIHVISALHKFLYNDVHNDYIKVADYFNEIVKLYNEIIMDEFDIIVDICDVSIKSERIIYFGLIFNELLTNTIEHNNNIDKKIEIIISPNGDDFDFMYTDYSLQLENQKQGTGSILINQLVNRVKGKEFSLNKTISCYKFIFNEHS